MIHLQPTITVLVLMLMGYDCNGVCLNDIDGGGICDEFEAGGCTDATACNYDSSATRR